MFVKTVTLNKTFILYPCERWWLEYVYKHEYII